MTPQKETEREPRKVSGELRNCKKCKGKGCRACHGHGIVAWMYRKGAVRNG